MKIAAFTQMMRYGNFIRGRKIIDIYGRFRVGGSVIWY